MPVPLFQLKRSKTDSYVIIQPATMFCRAKKIGCMDCGQEKPMRQWLREELRKGVRERVREGVQEGVQEGVRQR